MSNQFFKSKEASVKELSVLVNGKVIGDKEKIINSTSPIEKASSNDLTFISNSKYKKFLKSSKAGCCIISEKDYEKNHHINFIIVKDAYLAYAKIMNFLYVDPDIQAHIANNAYISKKAKIGNNVTIKDNAYISDGVVIGDNSIISQNCYIGDNCKIGNNCKIFQNVVIKKSLIGNNVIIHNSVNIGQDGFGYATDKEILTHIKIPQVGRVIIGNDVEIGSATCIDRGAGPDTIIGNMVKIDNLVQIGHNVEIGDGSIIVSQVAIAGSAKIGKYVVIGGQVGVSGHIEIGDFVNIAAKSGVTKDIGSKKNIAGHPAIELKEWQKRNVIFKKLTSK